MIINIYTLSDPRDSLVRYVGQSTNIRIRYNGHMKGNKYRNTHTANWIQGLINLGLKPVMDVIDTCEIKDLDKVEQAYIKLYKSFGCNLTNHSIGGHSSLGCKHSLESRLKRSIMSKGRVVIYSEETLKSKKEKHSQYLKDNPNQRIDNILSKEDRYKAALKGNKIASEKLKIPVYQYNLEGLLINTYSSITEAAIKTGINKDTMRSRCIGRYKQKGEFIFKIKFNKPKK